MMYNIPDLQQLYIALGNARMMKKYATTDKQEYAAIEAEYAICKQIDNYFRMAKVFDTKGEVVYAGKYKENRNMDLRSSIDLRV